VDHNLCVLIDFDNIAKGSRQEGLGEFDIRIVMRRLKDIGRVLIARAYCDWDRWSRHRSALAEQGITMVELVATGHGDKNRGDIALVCDAMELAYTRQFVDTFVILSGDSDFTPLVQRLKELNKNVIGIGTRGSTSRLLANVCDEFFFYDSIVKQRRQAEREREREEEEEEEDRGGRVPDKLKLDDAYALLLETLENHARDEAGPVHASIVKTSMKRKLSTFNEHEMGFRTFARFVERAQAEGLVVLSRDDRAGGWRVELAPQPGESGPTTIPPRVPAPRSAPVETPPPPVSPSPSRARVAGAAGNALALLQAEGLDIGTAAERRRVLAHFEACCTERATRGRRIAVQYLQGDLVQAGLDADIVRGVLIALARIGALRHADGDPIRGPTSPITDPPTADELNALLEERALELLGERGVKLPAEDLELLFGQVEDEGPAERPVEAAEAAEASVEDGGEEGGERRRRRRGGRGRGRTEGASEAPADAGDEPGSAPTPAVDVAGSGRGEAAAEGGGGAVAEAPPAKAKPSRRRAPAAEEAVPEGGDPAGGEAAAKPRRRAPRKA
jgi:uncharacterized protein (TIGR00288 family)